LHRQNQKSRQYRPAFPVHGDHLPPPLRHPSPAERSTKSQDPDLASCNPPGFRRTSLPCAHHQCARLHIARTCDLMLAEADARVKSTLFAGTRRRRQSRLRVTFADVFPRPHAWLFGRKFLSPTPLASTCSPTEGRDQGLGSAYPDHEPGRVRPSSGGHWTAQSRGDPSLSISGPLYSPSAATQISQTISESPWRGAAGLRCPK